MATSPYKAFPTNEPAAQPPPDYLHLDVSPGAFGGHIAKGLEQAGQSVSAVADLWGQIQTDSQLNSAMKESNDAVEQFKSLRGQDALNAQDGVRQHLDDIHEKFSSQLAPVQKLKFDEAYRSYQYRYLNGQITTHATAQGYDFSKQTNLASEQLAMDHAAANFNNPGEIDAAMHDARAAVIKQLQVDGRANDPATVTEAIRRADTAVYKSAAEAMYVHDPVGAAAFVEKHRKELGFAYEPLANQFRSRADQIEDRDTADNIKKAIGAGVVPAVPGAEPKTQPSNVVPLRPAPGAPAKDELGRTGGQGARIEVPFSPSMITPAGRAEMIENGLKSYQPGTKLSVSGREFTIPPAGTTFQYEGKSYTVPGARSVTPSAQKMNYSPERESEGAEAINAALTPGANRVAPDTPAIQEVAKSHGVSPEAVHSMIMLESRGRTTAKTGSYVGLTQIGPAEMKEMANAGVIPADVTYNKIRDMTADQQIDLYGKYLDYYKFGDKLRAAGVDVTKLSKPEQAAVLQGFQFAPNSTSWIRGLAQGNLDIPTTDTPQARVLGTTSIADMTRYYARRIGQ